MLSISTAVKGHREVFLMHKTTAGYLQTIYEKLLSKFGPQHWWPGETPFEVIVGAILTQNTNWGNVEKAIANLRTAGLLTPSGLKEIPLSQLAVLIKPSGYFNLKAKRLKNFVEFLFHEYHGDLQRMAREPLDVLRKKILSVNGIGPETADSILLYALEKSVFVIDAYTKRLLSRHALVDPAAEYQDMQKIFMENLPHDRQLFNEYHALIVKLGKDFCKPRARCEDCPLNQIHYSIDGRCTWCYRYLPRGENRYPVAMAGKSILYCSHTDLRIKESSIIPKRSKLADRNFENLLRLGIQKRPSQKGRPLYLCQKCYAA